MYRMYEFGYAAFLQILKISTAIKQRMKRMKYIINHSLLFLIFIFQNRMAEEKINKNKKLKNITSCTLCLVNTNAKSLMINSKMVYEVIMDSILLTPLSHSYHPLKMTLLWGSKPCSMLENSLSTLEKH